MRRREFITLLGGGGRLAAGGARAAAFWEAGTVKAYRYLTGKDDAAFCHRVTQALNNGWQLYGQPDSHI